MSTDPVLTAAQVHDIAIDAGCDPERDDGALVGRIARAFEQAVLQSPEIQALRRDAERYRWLCTNSGADDSIVEIFIYDEAWGEGHLDSQIDAAMEKQP